MAPKKLPLAKKLMIVGGALILLECIYIFAFSKKNDKSTLKDVINTQVAKNSSIASDRKDMVKIQVALSGYRVKNDRYPKQLKDLVPDFLDTVPLDPKTGVAYKYTLNGDRYSLGDESQLAENTPNLKGDTPDKTTDEQSRLLAYLDNEKSDDDFVYDSSKKKDPFRSHDFAPKQADSGGNTPLEKYSYDELKLSAILEGGDSPKAMVEDITGKGHVVSVGTKIGNTNGAIAKIEKDKIVIIEKTVEFTGETSTRTLEMYMRTTE